MSLRGSISRPLLAAVRSATKRSPHPTTRATPSAPAHASSSASASRFHTRPTLVSPRTLGVLGGAFSLLPLHSVVAASRLNSHLPVNSRACCGLSKGTFLRTCKDP